MDNRQQKYEPEQRTYNLRGMGVLCLVALLFAAGIWRFGEESMQVSSRTHNQALPVYSVDTEKKQIALTFDADEGDQYIGDILDILAKYDVEATFFMKGTWVEQYPVWVKKISEAGHDLGNHGQNYVNMSKLTEEEQTDEVLSVHESVKELTGIDMELYRPPYGEYNDKVIQNIKGNGYIPICWSVDSLDWKNYGANSIVDTVVNHRSLGNGDIVLMHIDAKYTAKALEQMIVGLQKRGYELVPVSVLLER